MMTINGFPWTVDHDTDYVTYAGNLGGVPSNWHVEYCRGEPQPRTPEDLGLSSGWNAEYFFFGNQAPGPDGYDLTGKSPNLKEVEAKIDFPNTASWVGGSHPATFPTSNYAGVFEGQLRILRGGEYLFQTTSSDGSRLSIDNSVVIDNWGTHGRRRREKLVELPEGWHNVKVEHYEGNGGQSAGGSVLQVAYKGDDTDDIELMIQEHIYHGKDGAITVNPPETTDSAESNPVGSSTININKATIGGASSTPVVAPFLQGPPGSNAGDHSPNWAVQGASINNGGSSGQEK